MRWPSLWGTTTPSEEDDINNRSNPPPSPSDLLTTLTSPQTYTSPSTVLPTLVLTTLIISTLTLSRRYLTRYPSASHIPPSHYRNRSLFGRVTSVGDADNFRLYHTPGGRLAGWDWLRRIPYTLPNPSPSNTTKQPTPKVKSDSTIHIRLAGIDAPELAHFGQPGQPYGPEALSFLKSLVLNRRVRVQLWRADQYGRAVGTVYVRHWGGLWRRDVGQAMLKAGMATVYEAKTGAEFGGKEQMYRKVEAEARAKGRGLWKGEGQKDWESPRMFKDRSKEEAAAGVGKKDVGRQGMLGRARRWFAFWK